MYLANQRSMGSRDYYLCTFVKLPLRVFRMSDLGKFGADCGIADDVVVVVVVDVVVLVVVVADEERCKPPCP